MNTDDVLWLARHAALLRDKAAGSVNPRVAEILKNAALRLELAARDLAKV